MLRQLGQASRGQRLRRDGRTPPNPTALQRLTAEAGIPAKLASCHTAKIGGYVIEGHVPATDIERLVAEKPEAIGLTVPGMPQGSPGMEQGGTIRALRRAAR